jgi:hypothetical protein
VVTWWRELRELRELREPWALLVPEPRSSLQQFPVAVQMLWQERLPK